MFGLEKLPVVGPAVFGTDEKPGLLDIVPGYGDARAQKKANETNIYLDKMNRDWMERMSNTAYQRAMADMKKGGLNPMLAFQQGPASSPNTAAPVVGAASSTGLFNAALQAYTGISAAQSQKMQAQTAQAAQQSTAFLQNAQAAQSVTASAKDQAETARIAENIKTEKVKRGLLETTKSMEKLKSRLGDFGLEAVNKWDDITKKGAKQLGDFMLKNSAKPTGKKIHPAKNITPKY